MEKLIQYVWKHKLFPLKQLTTTDGKVLEVINPGQQNFDAGPDFYNAKVKIDDTLWVGNVEIHEKSSDWHLHGHDTDKAYNNVILHVAESVNCEVKTESGECLPQLELPIPQKVVSNYNELLQADRYPPCYKIIPSLPELIIHGWMNSLQVERLEEKTHRIFTIADRCNGDWEKTYFCTLARNYGFGINGDAFETWSLNLPLGSVAHHCDDLFQIEAIFLGQAGLLDDYNSKYKIQQKEFDKLKREYTYLRHKFSLEPIDKCLWKYLRLRPNNFPNIKILQLASLYFDKKANLSVMLDCKSIKDVRGLYKSHSAKTVKLTDSSVDLLIINTIVPMLFAYGRHVGKEEYCTRAFEFYDRLKAEDNHMIRMWTECGLEVHSAGDSQALIQLKKEYCDKHECLRCRIGYEYLKGTKI